MELKENAGLAQQVPAKLWDWSETYSCS